MEDEYHVDDREVGGDVTDSDQEFDDIVDVDELIQSLKKQYETGIREESDVKTAHEEMLKLLQKIHSIADLIEFESDEVWSVFDQVIAPELPEIIKLENLVEMARLSYEIQLPYRAYWASMINVLLLSNQDFPLDDQKSSLLDFMYYVLKSQQLSSGSVY